MEIRKIDKNRPRIALLVDHWLDSREDSAVYVSNLARRLVEKHGYEVDLFARGKKSKFTKMEGLQVHIYPAYVYGPMTFLWLAMFGKQLQFSHAHGVRSAIAMKLASWINWKPTVMTVHGYRVFSNLLNPKTLLQRIVLLETRYTQQISASESFLKAKNINSPLPVIPSGVDCESFDEIELEKAPEQFVALFVGRINNMNGVDLLLKATQQLVSSSEFIRSNKDFRFEILGEGPYLKSFKKMVERYGIERYVRFRKWPTAETLLKYYKASDLFVLPARNAALPFRALQACAAGLPMLVSNTGDLKQLVLENQNGHLIEVNDTQDLAYYLEHFVLNPHLEKMGQVSRGIVEQEFTWEKCLQRHLNVYKEVAQFKPKPRRNKVRLYEYPFLWLKHQYRLKPRKWRAPMPFRFTVHLDDHLDDISPFLERLTEFCAHLNVPATFFVNPAQIEEYGHELGELMEGGYTLGVLADPEAWSRPPNRKKHIRQLRELLEKQKLQALCLFRAPSKPSEEELSYLEEYGFENCPISTDPLPKFKWKPFPKLYRQEMCLVDFLEWDDEDLLKAVYRFRNERKGKALNFQCSSREFASSSDLPHASGENFTLLSKKLSVLTESFPIEFL